MGDNKREKGTERKRQGRLKETLRKKGKIGRK